MICLPPPFCSFYFDLTNSAALSQRRKPASLNVGSTAPHLWVGLAVHIAAGVLLCGLLLS